MFFGSATCPHCKTMAPIVAKLAKKYPQIKFSHVEVSKVTVEDLDGVPCFIAFRDGTPIGKVEGADPEALENIIINKLR